MIFRQSKRRFLKASLSAAAATTVLSTFPPSIRRALAIGANSKTGTIKDVEHVVLLMLENRSFDSYFGTLKGVRGYGDRFAVPSPIGSNIFYQDCTQSGASTTLIPYHLDETAGNALRPGSTLHTWVDTQAAWDNGRMAAWPTAKSPLSMGYYEAAEVPFQRALADAFTLCDAYHCSMLAGTISNRLFYWTGTNGPRGLGPSDNKPVRVAAVNNEFNVGNGIGPSTEGWTWTTYADRLQRAGVNWKVYQSLSDNMGCNQMLGFRHWRAAIEQMPVARRPAFVPIADLAQPLTAAGASYDPAVDDALSPLAKGFGNTMPQGFLETFRDDIKKGALPSVSWIIPPSMYSEHPAPSSPVQGGWYLQEVLDALTSNPDVWSKTVLLVNYDENDGLFDHVPPPSAPSHFADGTLAGGSTLADSDMAYEYHNFQPVTSNQPAIDGRPYGPGPRVPMLVISPWSRGGFVNSQVFDHTSTLMFLEKRFGVVEPQISEYRRAVCGDLTSCFNFVDPDNGSLTALSGRTTKAAADTLATTQAAASTIATPSATARSTLPRQATGTRPSRALPYELHTTAHILTATRSVSLEFVNGSTKSAGAVFHVYDKNHLDIPPRRYVVEAGKSLFGTWTLPSSDNGRFDLWVVGPNGYHREFAGDLREVTAAANPEIQVCYQPCDSSWVVVKLHNRGTQACTFTVTAQAYVNDGPWTVMVPANSVKELSWAVANNGNWYDFSVSSNASARFKRRFAGRIENGKDLISDPAMGGAVAG